MLADSSAHPSVKRTDSLSDRTITISPIALGSRGGKFEGSSNAITTADNNSINHHSNHDSTRSNGGRSPPATSSTVALLILWLWLSCGIVFCNKYIISNLHFPYPATLTCWHLSAATLMTQGLAHFTTILDRRHDTRLRIADFIFVIGPIGLLFALSLVCNQIPYLSLSVAFIQMLKGLGPAFVLFAAWSLGLETPSVARCANIGVIVLGVSIATFGELKFAVSGFMYQILGLLLDGYRLGLTRKLMSGQRKLEPLLAFYYLAPVSAFFLAVAAWWMEWRAEAATELTWAMFMNLGGTVLLGSAALAFALNMVIMLLIGQTGPLTIPLCGEFKNIVIVIASTMLWGTVITPSQQFGYAISSIGLLYYSSGERLREIGRKWLWRWRHPRDDMASWSDDIRV